MSEVVLNGFLLAAVLIASGVVIQRIARRAARGDLKANPMAGIRTRATMASPEAWRVAHVEAERPTRLGGTLSVLGGLAALSVSILVLTDVLSESSGNVLVLVAVAVGMVGLLGFTGYGCVVGNRAAKEVLGNASS